MGDPRGIALLDRAHRGQMFFDVNLVTIHVKGHFWRCMLEHTKRQVWYYKSQLYNAFVISDVCNSSQ